MDFILDLLFAQDTLLLAVIIGAFLAAASVMYHIMPDEKISAAKKMLGVVDDSARVNKIFLLKILHPINSAIGRFFLEVKNQSISDYKRKKKRTLTSADLLREITPEEFIGFKIAIAVIFPVLTHYLVTILEQDIRSVYYFGLTALGFFAPDLWLMELVKKRRRAIFKHMPYTLDLLTLSVEAGLDFIAAIKRLVATAKPSPLIDELTTLLNEISLGTSRADALRNLAQRVQMEEINSFATLLIQADQLGASIGPVLRAQSDSMRATRFQRAEIAGARASQLLLFPMIFCIFPAIFIVIVGPIVIRFLVYGLTGIL